MQSILRKLIYLAKLLRWLEESLNSNNPRDTLNILESLKPESSKEAFQFEANIQKVNSKAFTHCLALPSKISTEFHKFLQQLNKEAVEKNGKPMTVEVCLQKLEELIANKIKQEEAHRLEKYSSLFSNAENDLSMSVEEKGEKDRSLKTLRALFNLISTNNNPTRLEKQKHEVKSSQFALQSKTKSYYTESKDFLDDIRKANNIKRDFWDSIFIKQLFDETKKYKDELHNRILAELVEAQIASVQVNPSEKMTKSNSSLNSESISKGEAKFYHYQRDDEFVDKALICLSKKGNNNVRALYDSSESFKIAVKKYNLMTELQSDLTKGEDLRPDRLSNFYARKDHPDNIKLLDTHRDHGAERFCKYVASIFAIAMVCTFILAKPGFMLWGALWKTKGRAYLEKVNTMSRPRAPAAPPPPIEQKQEKQEISHHRASASLSS